MSYADVVKKYGGTAAPAINPGSKPTPTPTPTPTGTPTVAPKIATPVIASDRQKIRETSVKKPTNRYDAIVVNRAKKQRQSYLAADEVQAQKDIESTLHPGIGTELGQMARAAPGALKEVVTAPFKNPKGTAYSVVAGLANLGPTIVRAVGGITGIKPLQKLSNPGDTSVGGEIATAIKKKFGINTDSDVQTAIREATTQAAAYELAGGALKSGASAIEARAIGAGGANAIKILTPATRIAIAESPKIARLAQYLGPGTVLGRVLGNVVGGQLTNESDNLKDRAKQAAFDAAFGFVTEGAIKGLGRAVRGKAPEIYSRTDFKSPGVIQPEVKTSEPAPAAGAEAKPTGETIKYIPKKNLGVDPTGEKVLAKTEVDAKTGRGIVYFDESLNANPELKAQVLDHEYGHIVDKRINNGSNISAEIPNYKGNQVNLDKVLSDFAKAQSKTAEQVAAEIKSDIDKLAQGSNSGEQFANAVAEYLHDPKAAEAKAPTFSAFLEHHTVEPRFTERTTTSKDINLSATEPAAKPQEKLPKTDLQAQGEKLLPVEKPAPRPRRSVAELEQDRFANRPDKVTLTPERQTGKEFKGIPPENLVHFNQGANPRVSVIVPAIDKSILSAEKAGARFSLRDWTIRQVMRVKGIDEAEAVAYMRTRAQYLRNLARANANKEHPVIINTVEKPKAPVVNVAEPHTVKVVDQAKLAQLDEHIVATDEAVKTMKQDFGPLEKFAKRDATNTLQLPELDKSRIKDWQIEWSKFEKYGVTDWEELRAAFEKYQEAKKQVAGTKSERAKVNKGERVLSAKGVEDVNKELSSLSTAETPPAHELNPQELPPTKQGQPKKGLIAQTGLDTGKTVETSGFNPKSVNAPEETTALLDRLAEKGGNDQRVSKNNEDIRDLARMTGLTEEQLLKAKPGSIANSETVTAARQLVLDKAQELMNYIKSVDVSAATSEQLAELRDKTVKLVSMQRTIAGFRTEASNVFRSLGIALRPGENATLSELGATLKQLGLASGDDASLFASKVAREMNLTTGQKIGQGALSTWYAAILSGPKTTVRNILSTASNIVTEFATKAANPKMWNEIPASVSGLLRGLKEGWGEAKAVLKGEASTTKFTETGRGVQPEVFTGKWKTYGQIVESVGRFLNAQDRLLSAGAREMERSALKVASPEMSDAISEALSKAYAETTVYHGQPKGKLIGALRDSAQTLRKKFPLAKIIIPFVDTVANVMDRQFDYMPLFSYLRTGESYLRPQAERIAREFGMSGDVAVQQIMNRLKDQQIGRMVLGTAITSAAVVAAVAGRVSGNGPTNVNERNQLQDTGWRPNSIKIGDTWVPYTYLGPLAGIFAMAGNVYDKVHYDGAPNKDIVSLLAKGLVGWTQTQLNQSFLSGAADLLDVLKGGVSPESYLKRLAVGLIPIPAAYSQTKDILFRQQYETRDIQEQVMNKLGITGGLQPKLNAFGQPLRADLIYGITPSTEKRDDVHDFLIKNELIVAKPATGQQYSIPGRHKEKRAFTPEEYTEYLEKTGSQIYNRLKSRIPSLAHVPDEQKKKQVESIVDDVRTLVRNQILTRKPSPSR